MDKSNTLPSPEQLFFSNNVLIRSDRVSDSSFGGGWHFHQEYELVLITKSSGTALIGDNVSSYGENDLYFTGVNLPHTWICDKSYNAAEAEAFVLHFKPELFSKSLIEQPEFVLLRQLLQKSKLGIRFSKKTEIKIRPLFEQLLKSEGIDRMVLILNMLDYCSKDINYTLLASEGFSSAFVRTSDEKLQKIIAFIENNYHRKINLNEIANLANMQSNAFCRYFKRKTNCSLFAFINKVRVGHACRLLLKGDLLIQEICHLSGFHSTSNFINQFRLRTGKTPKEYRDFYHTQLQL